MDCPILVWMVSYNRTVTPQEYDQLYRVIQECVPHAMPMEYSPQSSSSAAQLLAYTLPLLMMRHKRVPRHQWRDNRAPGNKRYIQRLPVPSLVAPETCESPIGYHLNFDNRLIGMAMTQGLQRDIVNIGIGIKELGIDQSMPAIQYVQSLRQKLTRRELSCFKPTDGSDVTVRRVCAILALKQAYVDALGLSAEFDLSLLEMDPQNNQARMNGELLNGWEFRLWQSKIAVRRDDDQIEVQLYQCAVAFFRGTQDTKFVWPTESKDIEPWVAYIALDDLFNVLPKLSE